MWPVAAGVAWSVCLSVGHSHEPCKNIWTNWDAIWDVDFGGPKEPCIGWGLRSAQGRGSFLGHPLPAMWPFAKTFWPLVMCVWCPCFRLETRWLSNSHQQHYCCAINSTVLWNAQASGLSVLIGRFWYCIAVAASACSQGIRLLLWKLRLIFCIDLCVCMCVCVSGQLLRWELKSFLPKDSFVHCNWCNLSNA